jgi:hypothetical protein
MHRRQNLKHGYISAVKSKPVNSWGEKPRGPLLYLQIYAPSMKAYEECSWPRQWMEPSGQLRNPDHSSQRTEGRAGSRACKNSTFSSSVQLHFCCTVPQTPSANISCELHLPIQITFQNDAITDGYSGVSESFADVCSRHELINPTLHDMRVVQKSPYLIFLVGSRPAWEKTLTDNKVSHSLHIYDIQYTKCSTVTRHRELGERSIGDRKVSRFPTTALGPALQLTQPRNGYRRALTPEATKPAIDA